MSFEGRPKKPLITQIAEGNPGKRSLEDLNLSQPTPDPHLPEAPDFLSDEAKREFEKISGLLYKNLLLTELDTYQLSLLCQAYGRWVMLERALAATSVLIRGSMGQPVANPLLIEASKAMDQVYKYLQQFGMSPASRSKIRLSNKKHDEEEDAWAKLVRQRAELRKKHLVSSTS